MMAVWRAQNDVTYVLSFCCFCFNFLHFMLANIRTLVLAVHSIPDEAYVYIAMEY